MYTIAVICLAPSVMFLAARLFSRQFPSSKRLAVFEWLIDAAFLLFLTLLLGCPLHRVTTSPWIGHPLSFTYGTTAALFSILMGAALGALQGLRRWNWTLTPSAGKPRRTQWLWRLPLHLLGLLTLVLTFAYLWGIRQYPIITLEEILFHLNAPLEGTAQSFVTDALLSVALPSGVLFALYELFVWLPGRSDGLTLHGFGCVRIRLSRPRCLPLPLALLFLCGMLSLLYSCADRYLDLSLYLSTHLQSSELIETQYVDPAQTVIAFPQEKRNLINIYIESGETTFQDEANGGIGDINYTPEMTKIAAQNITFSQSEKIQGAAVTPGTGWTIAALIAQTSGLPFKVFSNRIGSEMTDILPGVTTLDDILEQQGYRNVFMAGSDFTFGGRRQYFTQHGDLEIWDLLSAREAGLLPEDYYQGWGFEDRKLYAYAKEALTELAASSQPFHFSMLTVDTHTPGFSYDCCPDDISDPYLRVIACSSRQLSEFIEWCEQQPFFENTTIVITGDHASMTNPALFPSIDASVYDRYGGTTSRLVYNAFINAAAQPVRASNRLFTTLDLFPTVLASIGAEIDGDRLGLGTNLFSGRETLAEELGYDELFEELAKRSPFYNHHLMNP